MRIACVAFTLALLARAAICQITPPAGTEPQSKPVSLCTWEGTAVNSATGEPARKVGLTLSPFWGRGQTKQHTATADGNGHFIFQEVEPGKYTMQGGGNGYPNQMYGQETRRQHFNVIALEPGQHEKEFIFK